MSKSSLLTTMQADSGRAREQPPLNSRKCLSICGFTSFSRSYEEDTRTLQETNNRSLFNQANGSHTTKPIEKPSHEYVHPAGYSHPSTHLPTELENNIGELKWVIGKMKNQSRTARIRIPPLPPYHDIPHVKPNITWIEGLPRMVLNTSDKYVGLTTDILKGTGLSRGECESVIFQREISLQQVEFICDVVIAKEYKGWIFEYPTENRSITTLYVCAWLAYTVNWDVTWIHVDVRGSRVGEHSECVVIPGKAERKILEGSIVSIVKELYFLMWDDKDRILVIDGPPWDKELSPLYVWSRYWQERNDTKRRVIYVGDERLSGGIEPVEDEINRIRVFRARIPNSSFW